MSRLDNRMLSLNASSKARHGNRITIFDLLSSSTCCLRASDVPAGHDFHDSLLIHSLSCVCLPLFRPFFLRLFLLRLVGGISTPVVVDVIVLLSMTSCVPDTMSGSVDVDDWSLSWPHAWRGWTSASTPSGKSSRRFEVVVCSDAAGDVSADTSGKGDRSEGRSGETWELMGGWTPDSRMEGDRVRLSVGSSS